MCGGINLSQCIPVADDDNGKTPKNKIIFPSLFILSVSLCGNLIWNFLNNVIQPNMFIPMITMNKPAIIFNIPCRSSGIPIPPPPVNSIPIPPSKKPITEYKNTDGKLTVSVADLDTYTDQFASWDGPVK